MMPDKDVVRLLDLRVEYDGVIGRAGCG